MSFVRNREVSPPSLSKMITRFVLIAGMIGLIFHKDFAGPIRGVIISCSIALGYLLFYWIWLWRPARMQVANEFVIETHRKDQNRLTIEECRQEGLVMLGKGLPLASLQKQPKN